MADIAFEKDISVTETGIGGLKVVDLAAVSYTHLRAHETT